MVRSGRLVINIFFEMIEAIGLFFSLILIQPIMILRNMNRIKRLGWYVRFLLPRGLAASTLRAGIDRALGNHELAAGTLSYVLAVLEKEKLPEDHQAPFVQMMMVLYTNLVRLYLAASRIDDATHVIVRASSHLKMDALPEFPDFDIRIAHIVKAGIAAGKLLEEGGLATLMVKHGGEPAVGTGTPPPQPTQPKPKRVRRKFPEKMIPRVDSGEKRGVIIPFPEPHPH